MNSYFFQICEIQKHQNLKQNNQHSVISSYPLNPGLNVLYENSCVAKGLERTTKHMRNIKISLNHLYQNEQTARLSECCLRDVKKTITFSPIQVLDPS